MRNDNYISRKQQLLKSFDSSIARGKRVLIYRYGNEHANSLIRESRSEYESLIPQIPFIGNNNPLLIFLLPTSRYLSIYRVLLRMGLTHVDAIQIIYQMNEAELKAIPYPVRRIIGYLWFSPWLIKRFRKRAKESQERKYSGGYVFTFIEGDGQKFDYGIDYTECAGCKFLNEQNAPELAPFLCALDKVSSEMLYWGLTRTMTIAEGFEKCDFRFKKGGKTDVALPQSLMQVARSSMT
jgi:hypothetical protein